MRKNHAYADLFPLMSAAELDALTADIQENGLRQPIVLYGGLVLDGRNRLKACQAAGVEHAFVEHGGDDSARALVISLNIQRRDLTAAQRAIAAARCMDQTQKQSRNGRKTVAGQFKVGQVSVQQAKAILAEAPDLAAQVEGSALSLAAAYEKLQQRRNEASQAARDAELAREYEDAIAGGELTLAEAVKKIRDEERRSREAADADASARHTWHSNVEQALTLIEEWVAAREDARLLYYVEPGAAGTEHALTKERLFAAAQQLIRIQLLYFGDESNGRGPRR
jgi:ParB-like chromosome segregation protein Spo0J